MAVEFKNWRNELTEDEIKAIAGYTNGHYSSINNYLRENGGYTDAEKASAAAKQLNSALGRHELSKDMTVYRGTGSVDAKTLALMTTPGSVWHDKGVFSTSLSRDFARSWSSSKSNPIVFTIRLPKGFKNAGYVQSISPHKSEQEVIIKPGTNWRVVKELAPLSGGARHVLLEPI